MGQQKCKHSSISYLNALATKAPPHTAPVNPGTFPSGSVLTLAPG